MCPIHLRLLVATEPLSYREVLGHSIRELRPNVEVVLVESKALDETIVRMHPEVVLCSHLTTAVVAHVPAWIALYPDGQRLTVTGINGRYTTATDLGLEQILAVIDQTEVLLTPSAPSIGAESSSV